MPARRPAASAVDEQRIHFPATGNRQHDGVLQLQQTVGNQATRELVEQGQLDNWQQPHFQGLPPVRGTAADSIVMTAPIQVMRDTLAPDLVGDDGVTITDQRGKEVSAGEVGFSSAMLEDQGLMIEANLERYKDW
jgi:hypothetical protein